MDAPRDSALLARLALSFALLVPIGSACSDSDPSGTGMGGGAGGGGGGEGPPGHCGDGSCGAGETCLSCEDDCGPCPEGHCNDGMLSEGEEGVDCGGPCLACDYPQGRSEKRGVAYNFCDWHFSEGQDDLDLLKEGTVEGSGVTWTYNWGRSPTGCIADSPDLGTAVEFVPMVWGLHQGGAACAAGGPCFTDARTRDQLVSELPASARYLLGYNEPNFAHQANLTPTVAAVAWTHLEYVADARGLELVGPAINFCDTTPGSDHGGSCTEEPAQRTFTFDDYEITFPAGYRYNAFEWAELFYDECSAAGSAGYDCRIDYQAGHVYSWYGLGWFIDIWKRKAGIDPPAAPHCEDGEQNEDEFGVDCGGNDCAACSAWARAQFAKALWLTEFSPSTDDAPGSPPVTPIERASEYIESELPILEGDAFVFRYAWFMPKTDIGSLDHVDLLTESTPVERTPAGLAYMNHSH